MYSSGTTAIATASAAAVALMTIPAGASYNVLRIVNERSVAGFFSVDGGATWGRIPAATTSSVNQVNSIPFVDTVGSGTFMLTVEGTPTGAITYSSTLSTLITNINAGLDAALGAGSVVVSGASLATLVLTGSGTGYSGRPLGTITATILSGSSLYTINGSGTVGTPSTCAVTTAGAASASHGEVEWKGRSSTSPQMKRDGGSNMGGVFAFADWVDYR